MAKKKVTKPIPEVKKTLDFYIELNVYPIGINVFIGENREDFNKYIRDILPDDKQFDKELTKMNDNNGALTVTLENELIFIWFKTTIDNVHYEHIIHEVTHATIYLFEIIGMPINADTSEALAYANQYISETIREEIHNAING